MEWSRSIGQSSPSLYIAVFSLFLCSSFLRDSSLYWFPAIAGILLAIFLKMNPSDLLVLALPFHFVLSSWLLATVSLGHLVLPIAVAHVLLANVRNKEPAEVRLATAFLAGWLFLFLIATPVASIGNEVHWPAFLLGSMKLTVSVGFGFWIVRVVDPVGIDVSRVLALLKIWVWTAAAVAVIGFAAQLVSAVWDLQTPFFYHTTRLMATFENPNHFGLHMLVSALFSLLLSLKLESRLFLALALFLGYSAVQSGSQTAHVAVLFAAALAAVVFLRNPDFRVKTMLFCFASVLFVLIRYFEPQKPAPGNPRLGLTGELSQVTGDLRWTIWREGLDLWSESPWFGIGYGQFSRVSEIRLGLHNTGLDLLLGGGSVIFLLSFALIFVIIVRGLRAPGIAPVLAVALAAVTVFGLGNNVLHAAPFWIVLGLLGGVVVQENTITGLPLRWSRLKKRGAKNRSSDSSKSGAD